MRVAAVLPQRLFGSVAVEVLIVEKVSLTISRVIPVGALRCEDQSQKKKTRSADLHRQQHSQKILKLFLPLVFHPGVIS